MVNERVRTIGDEWRRGEVWESRRASMAIGQAVLARRNRERGWRGAQAAFFDARRYGWLRLWSGRIALGVIAATVATCWLMR